MNAKPLLLKGLKFSLDRKEGQVSHGLNLVLKLRKGASMVEVLAQIRKTQRRIESGLDELNFVHFARFLPTYDNQALQVITEFDGPLAPYVLDFAIEIGDIFDLLLERTQGTKDIVPIAEHPAEFLAFVEKHNTVKVLTQSFPEWPVHAAYPDKTLLDIVGPRDDLPIPKADRCATEVERTDVQGNILKGYGAAGVRHFLLEVVTPAKARAWLADKANVDDPSVGASPKVTSYRLWKDDEKPNVMLNVGLTYAGMKALEIRDSWLKFFPEAFKQGALKRAKDNFDVECNAPQFWWLGGPSQAPHLHIMLSLYYRSGAEQPFEAAANALTQSMPAGGVRLIAHYDATSKCGVGWFGYADGIATPRIAAKCPDPRDAEDLQPAAGAGEFVLGKKYWNIYGGPSLGGLPEELATNGTFCAVRVLAQDTSAFDEMLLAQAQKLGVAKDWLAAKLMGRWFNGAPISLYPDPQPLPPPVNTRNDFDFAPSYEYPRTPMDHFGAVCPVGAHIRRSNPRTARVAGARYARRLMRRGMHYEIKNQQGQRQEVGLFGLFICADLERQFEFIQRQWLNGDVFAAGLRGTRDPFVGTPVGKEHKFEIPMPAGQQALTVSLPQLVHTKGSAYFFMPGLNALKNLEDFAKTNYSIPKDKSASAADRDIASGAKELLDVVRKIRLLPKLAGLSVDALMELAQSLAGNARVAPSASQATPGKFAFDPRRRDFQIDPYRVFAEFRKSAPVHYSPLYEGWFVFRYEDIVNVCTDDASYSAAAHDDLTPRGLFTLDPPEHTKVKEAIVKAWTNAMQSAQVSIRNSVDTALAAIAGQQRCFDLVDDFARPVPREVYFDILGAKGISPEEREEIDRLARTMLMHHDHLLDPLQRIDGTLAAAHLLFLMAKMLVQAQLDPKFKGSFLFHLGKEFKPFGNFKRLLIALVSLVTLTGAGYMSVEFLLATGIRRLLLESRKGWEHLLTAPGDLGSYLKEMRRFEHGLAVIDRFTKTEVTIGQVVIPKHARIFAVLASANRDACVFKQDDPEVFKPGRPYPDAHIAFGHGTHRCIGISLESLITPVAIKGLLDAKPDLRLRSNAEPHWFENFYFRSFHHLALVSS